MTSAMGATSLHDVFDADTHLYEADDCFSRYLPRKFRDRAVCVRQVTGSRAWWFGDRQFTFVPDAIDAAHRPGDGVNFIADPAAMVRESTDQPPYRDRDARIATMDSHGVASALIYPNLGIVAEFEMLDDVEALCANLTSFNRWLDDEWGFRYRERLFAVPVVSMEDVVWAEQELERVVVAGARMVLLRAGPLTSGISPANPVYDAFWSYAATHGVPVGFHIAQSGYTKWFGAQWGENPAPADAAISPFQAFTCFGARPMQDMFLNLVLNNLFGRFPDLRVVSVENGIGWIAPILGLEPLIASLRRDGRPAPVDPLSDIMRRNLYVVPGPFEDPQAAIELVGSDNVMFGSDYPHPEGLQLPLDYLERLTLLSHDERSKLLGGNIRRLLARSS